MELEAENAKRNRMYAELALENTAIKDVLSRELWRRRRSGQQSR
jgi:putative transposase